MAPSTTNSRCKPVAMGAGGVYAKLFTFIREWFQPRAWTLQQFGWSRMSHAGDTPVEQGRHNISYLELTCAIDLLTGGAAGPNGAPFLAKAALVKYGVSELLRATSVNFQLYHLF